MSVAPRPAVAARLRRERTARGWDVPEMARRLREAAADIRADVPDHDTLVSYIRKRWESGRHDISERYRLLYCKAFGMMEEQLFDGRASTTATPSGGQPVEEGHGGYVEEVEPTKRRDALKLGLAASLAPELLPRVLRDAAAEAMEFTRRASVTAVGSGTFAHLEAVLTDLDRSYSVHAPTDLFVVVRAYRLRVAEMLQGPHTLKERRELYVYAAWLSEFLAWLTHDLGDAMAAESWAIDSFQHAEQAGHGELCAWAADARASIAMYMSRPDRAVAAAREGMTAVPSRHPLAVRLRAQAARGFARMGHRDECEAHLREAGELYELLPTRTPLRFSVDTGTLAAFAVTSYAASSCIWLEDFKQAKAHAQAAIAVHESAPASTRAPSREAIARIDLAIAMAELGAPDEAIALGHQALESSRVVDSVRQRAGDLDATLTRHYPLLSEARDFHEAYVQLAGRTRAGKR